MKRWTQQILLLGVASFFVVFTVAGVVGATASISKGYISSDSQLQTGMAVALSDDSSGDEQYVERVSTENKSKYIGIATRIDGSVVTISNSSATVYVANSGQYEVFVSDLNGEVKKGDVLVVSPLKGILMRRADDGKNDSTVAIALADASGSSVADIQRVQIENGDPREVKISKLKAEINTNAIIQDEQKKFFSVFGESLTGKPVSEVRVLIACVILLFVLIIEGSLLYGAVSSSITATGRNPLSKKAIYKQLIYTSFMALVILLVGLAGIYVVIWT